MKKVTVYRTYSGKPGEHHFSLRNGVEVAGDFEFVSHPDDCPNGRWQYYPRCFYGNYGPQPDYHWLNMHEPIMVSSQ